MNFLLKILFCIYLDFPRAAYIFSQCSMFMTAQDVAELSAKSLWARLLASE